MDFRKTIYITEDEKKEFDRMCFIEPKDEDDFDAHYLNEDTTISKTAKFDNGYEVDVKLCGVQYHDGESNTMWTEAVLFDSNGSECACSDPSEGFDGIWELEYDGHNYIVTVEVQCEKK